MAARFKRASQVEMIVNFAVINELERVVFVADRFVAAVQIDDGKPTMDESHAGVDKIPLGIRPAMRDQVAHRLEHGCFRPAAPITINYTCDSTHSCIVPSINPEARLFLRRLLGGLRPERRLVDFDNAPLAPATLAPLRNPELVWSPQNQRR